MIRPRAKLDLRGYKDSFEPLHPALQVMPFTTVAEYLDARGLFVVQDPSIRSSILPLFAFDPRSPNNRPAGHGTAFRIDPWGGCAGAFHVIEDLLTVQNGKLSLGRTFGWQPWSLSTLPMALRPCPWTAGGLLRYVQHLSDRCATVCSTAYSKPHGISISGYQAVRRRAGKYAFSSPRPVPMAGG